MKRVKLKIGEFLRVPQFLAEIRDGLANHTDLLNVRLKEAIQGIDNQAEVLNDKLKEVIQGIDIQTEVLNDKLKEVVQGIDNQAEVLNDKLKEVIQGIDNQTEVLNDKLKEVVQGIDNQAEVLNDKLKEVIEGLDNQSMTLGAKFSEAAETRANDVSSVFYSNQQHAVEPLSDIEFVGIDLTINYDPVSKIVESPEFASTARYFTKNPAAARSLVSGDSQALIFTLVRNLAPSHVVEIGTFKGGTSEAIARALHANGGGLLHTVGPFDGRDFMSIFNAWPAPLQRRVLFYALDSMAFFMRAQKHRIGPGLVFVDGNHDYEFALFDILAASKCLLPGGFIVVDNISQAGPYHAASDFLASHPGWTNCVERTAKVDPTKAYDSERTGIRNTDMMVIRAPLEKIIDQRPSCAGEIILKRPTITGVEIDCSAASAGILHVQCVLRGFSNTSNIEAVEMVSVPTNGLQETILAKFTKPLTLDDDFVQYRAEVWLSFFGDGHLAQRSAVRIV